MSPSALLRNVLDDLSLLSVQQRVLRALVLLGPVLVLVAEAGAGGSAGAGYLVVVLLLTALAAVLPDGSVALVLLVLLGLHWTAAAEDRLSPWLVLAATGFLLVHVGCTLAAYGPVTVALPGTLLRLWAWRAARVLAVTVLVWFGVGLVSLAGAPGSPTLLAVTLVLLCAAALLAGSSALAPLRTDETAQTNRG